MAHENLNDEDDFERWLAEAQESDPNLAGAINDADRRHRLLRSLVAARHAAGLTQAQVAEEMQTTQSAVSEMEGGITDPRLSTLQRYARAIGLVIEIEAAPVVDYRQTISMPHRVVFESFPEGARFVSLPVGGWTDTLVGTPVTTLAPAAA